MVSRKILILRKLYIFFFSIIVVVDSLNGFLLNELGVNISIGQVFRFFIFGVMLLILLTLPTKKRAPIFMILYYFLLMQFVFYALFGKFNFLISDITETFKPLLVILLIESYKTLSNNNLMNKMDIIKIIKINVILFPLSIVIPKLLHLGSYVYGNGSGYKAFYNANNDLNVVLLILLVFSLNQLLSSLQEKKKIIYNAFVFLLCLITLLLIGSKSSFFFSIVIIFSFIIRSLVTSKFSINLKTKIVVFYGALIAIAFYLLRKFYMQELLLIYERQYYFFRKEFLNNENPLRFFLTGRDEFLISAYHAFINNSINWFQLLFGIGKAQHAALTGLQFGREYLIIEMDLFDIFFSYGLMGTLILYGYLVKQLINSYKARQLTFQVSLAYFVVASFSFLGGHVLFSALSGSFLALVCCLLYGSHSDDTNDFKIPTNNSTTKRSPITRTSIQLYNK